MTDGELSTLMAGAAGYSETQLVVLVLSVLVVAVALLSYFVVAPEYEKRLDKQYAEASTARQQQSQQAQELLLSRLKLRKHKSLGAWDIEAGSSDDDALDPSALQRRHSHIRPPPASTSSPREMQTEEARVARKERNARRRKSESDALKQANMARADMLRRRVLLRKLEEEIAGALKENDDAQTAANGGDPSRNLGAGVRRLSSNSLELSVDRLKMLQEHPADCAEELTVLARAQTAASAPLVESVAAVKGQKEAGPDLHEVKRALHVLHDVLSFYLSVDHRDMNKLSVFCNSLLQHDGLNRLRAFEASRDQDVRTLSNSIIEKAVPAIWH
ncbi:hypothetical protein BBJ28_00014388 [Nothophytophthora sp. Chile5]|nr:hypothetical protein BBJ28_00014388 [Nothophytophthora sp. Chile5]